MTTDNIKTGRSFEQDKDVLVAMLLFFNWVKYQLKVLNRESNIIK